MNLYDLLLLAALAGAVFLAVRKILRDKKRGKCCGGGTGCCASCPHSK